MPSATLISFVSENIMENFYFYFMKRFSKENLMVGNKTAVF